MRIKVRRIIAMPLIFILMFTSCLYIYPKQVEAKESSLYQGTGFEVKFYLDSVYEDGYNARIELTNTSSQMIKDWTLDFTFAENISSAWNGMFSKFEDGMYQIKNVGWNQDIEAGETVTFGFSGSCTQTPNAPTDYELIGMQRIAAPKEYNIKCDLVEQWSSGYIVQVNITNLTAFTMKDWILEFTSQNKLESMWGANVLTNSDSTYQVRNNNNQNILAYNTVSFNYMVTSNTYVEPCNFKLFYQSLDNTLIESLTPTISTTEDPIKSVEPTMTEGQTTANPTESILPTVSEVPVSSEPPKESEEPEELDMTDTDGDGLIDVLEKVIGTDPLLKDTDGDILTDYEETYLVGTDPLLIDSDGNGIIDSNDDFDIDGLANLEELKRGTSAVCVDSDYDRLKDGEEVNKYGTDPLNEDTDSDTITDGDEILFGMNPLLIDSDGDGVLDNEEKIEQTFSATIEDEEKKEVTNVEVAFAGTGNIEDTTEIESVYVKDKYSSELAGLVGVPIEIETESEFDKATITFSYDESKLGDVKEENLAIMWYDEKNHDYVQMDSTIDKEKNTVSCDTTHFSVYTLIDKQAWKDFWSVPIQYPYLDYMDIAVVCENTYEMFDLADVTTMIGANLAGNLSMLDHICEIEYGKSACVEFEFGRESELTNGEINEDFYDALVYRAEKNSKYVVEEGYNASKGIELAIEELNNLNSGNEKAILLLSSGNGLDDTDNAVKLASKYNISITTVDYDNKKEYSSTFKNIAEKTGGRYFDISDYNFNIYDDLEEIANNTVMSFKRKEIKDADGDGLADIYELNGVKASNGTIVKTDYKKADTDGDGLTDKEELNLKSNTETGEAVAYLCSDPRYTDTDGDSYSDYDEVTKYKSNAYKNEVYMYRWNKGYINVDYTGEEYWKSNNKTTVSYGGYQGWFFNDDKKKWYSKLTDGYTIQNYGCGLISASDILLYLSQCNTKYATKTTKEVVKNGSGNINYDSYTDYINYMHAHYMTVYPIIGVIGTSVALGIDHYSDDNNLGLHAKWGVSKKKILPKIKEMLRNDIPVTLSIGICRSEKGVHLYNWTPQNNDKYSFEVGYDNNIVKNHYVTVTGLLVDKVKGQTMLEISTWGKHYYINFKEYTNIIKNYSDYISSNIVYVKK